MTDITELAQRMKAAAEKATPGEWWADEVKNEGCYGSGDDCVEGFASGLGSTILPTSAGAVALACGKFTTRSPKNPLNETPLRRVCLIIRES